MGSGGSSVLETISEPIQVRDAGGGVNNRLVFLFLFSVIKCRRVSCFCSAHVLTEDTVTREVRGDGKLHSKRILTKTNPAPKWGERLCKTKIVLIVEESVVDPKNKTLVTYTRNIGFNTIMVSARVRLRSCFGGSLHQPFLDLLLQSVVEKVTYTVCPEVPGKTVAIRSAWIDSQVYGLATAIRAFGVERFRKNCNKTILGFNYVLQALFPAGLGMQHKDLSMSANKFKEAAKTASEHVKAQAEQIYQAYSVKN